jgi:hypothetical protein
VTMLIKFTGQNANQMDNDKLPIYPAYG